jgi:hypothetical protein
MEKAQKKISFALKKILSFGRTIKKLPPEESIVISGEKQEETMGITAKMASCLRRISRLGIEKLYHRLVEDQGNRLPF